MPEDADPWVTAFLLLLSGGGAKFVFDAVRAWRNAPPRAARDAQAVDANIATVARARDELEADNARLREVIVEERRQRAEDESRHAIERARWMFDQDRLRADVERLEAQIRAERDAAAARYDELLAQVHNLRLQSRMEPDG